MLRGLALLLLTVVSAQAQGPGPGVTVRFDRLGLEDGLSQSSVLAVLQDRRGFLWFGTQDGINRYDGVRITTYRHDPTDGGGLPTSYVQSLAETRDGALWIGTWGGGLARLDPVTEQFSVFSHVEGDATSLPGDIVTALHEDASGRLWVGTSGGLALFENGAFRPYAAAILPDPFVWSLAGTPDGDLWVGTYRAGAVRITPETGRWTPFRHDPERASSLSADEAALVRVTPSGAVWIGSSTGANRYLGAGRFERSARQDGVPGTLCGDDIYDIRATRDGAVWVATGDGGLCRRVAGSETWEAFRHNPADPSSLPKDVVRALWQDRAGTLWIGTDGGGAAAYTGASERMGLYKPDPLDPTSLSAPYVWALHQTRDGSVWVGTDGGGLGRLDPATGRFETERHRPGDASSLGADIVLALEASADGSLWVGLFDAGLDRVDPSTGRIEHFPFDRDGAAGPPVSALTALHEDPAGALWIGTWGEGLVRRTPDGAWTVWRHDGSDPGSLPNDVITTIQPAADGGLWIGTDGGGLAHRAPDGRFRHWDGDDDGPLSHPTVYGIHQDAEGIVWLATAGGGLDRLDPATGDVRVLTTRDGLPHNIIYGVLPGTDGELWLSTNDGLARFDPATGAVETYGTAQGAQGPEFNSDAAFRAEDGSLLFGGTLGFNWFHPDALTPATDRPRVVLTGLRRFDEPVPLRRSLESLAGVALSHHDNFVTVEFAAPGASDAAGVRYAYRLDGVDPAWRDASGARPEASYTNLEPGRYTFRVRAAERGGVWGPERLLDVHVVPPWWATWWARGLAGLLILAGSGVAVQAWRHRRARDAARVAAEAEEARRRLAAGREAERLRLARDLHDGPLQDLYGARFRLDALGDALGGDRQPDVGRAQATALAVEKTLLDVGKQLRAVCTELRPPVLGALGIARALRADADRLAAAHPETSVELALTDEGLGLDDAARVAVYRVAQEALRNAFRHAGAGTVRVSAEESGARFTVRVEDDGSGFAVPARWAMLARDGHLGLAGASERAAAVGGDFEVRSRPGRGTLVTVSVPLVPAPASS